jgi:RNA polymerase sigma-70 factor (ECF subfamily)
MEKSLEQKWLKQLADDNKKAYEIIFKAHYQSVYLSALRITKDGNSAKDAAQEVFLELWKNRHKLNISSSLKAYLCRGAVNRSLNSIKSRNHHAGQDLATIVEPNSKNSTPDELTETKELKAKIHQEINNLPKRCRQVFVLSRFEGKKYKEIANLMGISIKTVENQMLKALKTLRKAVAEYRE